MCYAVLQEWRTAVLEETLLSVKIVTGGEASDIGVGDATVGNRNPFARSTEAEDAVPVGNSGGVFAGTPKPGANGSREKVSRHACSIWRPSVPPGLLCRCAGSFGVTWVVLRQPAPCHCTPSGIIDVSWTRSAPLLGVPLHQ